MRIALHDVAPATRKLILGRIALAIATSAFRSRAAWHAGVVVLRDGRASVTSRADFASWLRANALPELATECMHRRLRRGEVILFLDHEGQAEAVTRFVVVDLAREARALKGTHP